MQRRLSAILYADVAGYSRLTGADEDGTHRSLRKALSEFSEVIKRHGGRICHFAGDAVLAEFATVAGAMECGLDAQREFAARDATVPEESRLRFRIGINLGDVIVDGEDIYGDGVNVAARLEALAEPGGICISGTVYQAIEGKFDLRFDDLHEQRVKNIERPIRAYRVAVEPEGGSEGRSRGENAWRRRWVVAAILIGFLLIGVTAAKLFLDHDPNEVAKKQCVDHLGLPVPESECR